MAKKDKENTVQDLDEENIVKINNWDDWFNLCNTLSEPMQEYQEVMAHYIFYVKHGKKDEDQKEALKEYRAKRKVGWFKEEPKLSASYLSKVFIGGSVGLAAGLIIGLLISFMMLGGLSIGAIAGCMVGCCVVGAALTWGIYLIRINSCFKKLARLEDEMKDGIQYIPPKYRNQQAVEAFYDEYNSYGVPTFDQAVEFVDDYLVEFGLIGAYMAIMFDVPYTNIKDAASDYKSGDEGSDVDMSDPAMPADIKSKTFEGVDNPDEQG